jgi:hypothetical protein
MMIEQHCSRDTMRCSAVQKPIYLLLYSSGVLVSALSCRCHRVDEGPKLLDLI